MIDYSPFWRTLKASNENWYTLTKKHHISDSSRTNAPISISFTIVLLLLFAGLSSFCFPCIIARKTGRLQALL